MNEALSMDILDLFTKDRLDFVSFAEIHNRLGGKHDLCGDHAMALGSNEHLVCWAGMSQDFIDAMRSLTSPEGPLVMRGTSGMVYMADGYMLKLPVFSNKTPLDTTKDHWVPVTMRLKSVNAQTPKAF